VLLPPTAPAPARLKGHILGRPQDHLGVKEGQRAAWVLRQGSVKGLCQLVVRVGRIIGVAVDTRLNLGQAVPVGGERGAVPRLDGFSSGGVERVGECRRVIEAHDSQPVS
jgi:hypothetical protein